MAEPEITENLNNKRLFQIGISNSLRKIAESVSEDEFLKILTIFKSKPSIAQKLHKAMIEELYNSMNNDLEDIVEGDLQDGLRKIAKLSEENTIFTNEDTWRPAGNINLHMRSLDAHKIKEATEDLEKQVNDIESENDNLMKIISEKRSKILTTNDNVTGILNRSSDILQQLQQTYKSLTDCIKIIENK